MGARGAYLRAGLLRRAGLTPSPALLIEKLSPFFARFGAKNISDLPEAKLKLYSLTCPCPRSTNLVLVSSLMPMGP